jgi:hypothetical protein
VSLLYIKVAKHMTICTYCLPRALFSQVRVVPRLAFRLIVARWEPRTILLLLDHGVYLQYLWLDVRTTTRLHDHTGPYIHGVGDGVSYWHGGKLSKNYTDAVWVYHLTAEARARALPMLEFVGLMELAASKVAVHLETKCLAGSMVRGEIGRDCCKWVATDSEGNPLIVLFYTLNGLIVACCLSKEGRSARECMLEVTAAYYWPLSNGSRDVVGGVDTPRGSASTCGQVPLPGPLASLDEERGYRQRRRNCSSPV